MDIEKFLAGYIECALWSSTDENCEPLDNNYELSKIALSKMRTDCIDFIKSNGTDLASLDAAQCGHDFWLTRTHHGAGFWDRGLGDLGLRLTDASHTYSECDLYVGDDQKLYIA